MQSLTERLRPLLTGAVPLSDLDTHTMEALSIFIYFKASAIVDSGNPVKIKAEIEAVPEVVRDMVRDKCMRLYRSRFL